jgi:hypothetical protein
MRPNVIFFSNKKCIHLIFLKPEGTQLGKYLFGGFLQGEFHEG